MISWHKQRVVEPKGAAGVYITLHLIHIYLINLNYPHTSLYVFITCKQTYYLDLDMDICYMHQLNFIDSY